MCVRSRSHLSEFGMVNLSMTYDMDEVDTPRYPSAKSLTSENLDVRNFFLKIGSMSYCKDILFSIKADLPRRSFRSSGHRHFQG